MGGAAAPRRSVSFCAKYQQGAEKLRKVFCGTKLEESSLICAAYVLFSHAPPSVSKLPCVVAHAGTPP
jgi:hypothetical protein